MRRLLAALLSLALLAGCLPVRSGGERGNGVAAQVPSVSATPLISEPSPPAVETQAAAPVTARPPPSAPPKTPGRIACEADGGRFATAGNASTFVCQRATRDGGTPCRAETDCEGLCLARSRSCSPVAPLLGCQDILTQDGLRVTQCVE